MEELSLIARHEPGIAQIENFTELKAILDRNCLDTKDLFFRKKA